MKKSQEIVQYERRETMYCKKCFTTIKKRKHFVCSCFFSEKELGCLIIDSDLYYNMTMQIYQSELDQIRIDNFNVVNPKQLFSIIKVLINIFGNGSTLSQNIVSKYQGVDSDANLLFVTDNNVCIANLSERDKCRLFTLYQYYFSTVRDYQFSKKLSEILIEKIKYLNENDSCLKSCRNCCKLEQNLQKLKEEYNNIFKNFSNAQSEKEKIVMKYVKTEKRVLEAQKSVDLANKQRDDAFKENLSIQKKFKKAQDDITKLVNESKRKQTEMTQLKNYLEQLKEVDNIKEIKLKGLQNRLKFISDNQEETQRKLVDSSKTISDLKSECESLRSNIHQFQKTLTGINETTNLQLVPSSDENLKHHLDYPEQNLAHKLQISEERRKISEKENNLLLSQIQLLQNEFTDLKTKLNSINTLYEKEKEEGQIIRSQLCQMEDKNNLLEIKANQLDKVDIELQLLQKEKTELLTDMDTYRQREMQMLGFTEQVTDKYVELQSKFTNLNTKLLILENNQDPLLKSINKLTSKIKTLEHNLCSEKLKHNQECEILTKCLAEQIYYSQKLAQQLEETEGDNIILSKKKELSVRKMTRDS